MATVSLIQMLAGGVTTSTGAPVASGKVFFYLPSTFTPVSVYADSLGATPIAPPLTLTAGGTGIAYTKVPTRMIVKDSNSVTTYFDGLVNIQRAEQQMIQSASINGGAETTSQAFYDALGATFGGTAGIAKYKAPNGTSERTFPEVIGDIWLSTKDLGAVVDGIVNDTIAIQNTVNAAAARGGGIAYLPPGTSMTSAAISVPAGVSVQGAGSAVSIIKCTGGSQGGFFTSGANAARFQRFGLTHSTTSTGTAITSDASASIEIDSVAIDPVFRTAISTTGAGRVAIFNTTAASNQSDGSSVTASIASINSAPVFVYGSKVTGGALSAIKITGNSNLVISNNSIVATTCTVGGIDYNGTGAVETSGNQIISGGQIAIAIGSSAINVLLGKDYCTGPITDARSASTAPVGYTFAGSGNFTPLPLQTEHIRAIATAAGTVTVNAIGATGFGRKWSLYCINSSGGAVVWAFNAQYKLAGGAAPAPATGNMVIMVFEYDPISAVVREVSRSGTVAI